MLGPYGMVGIQARRDVCLLCHQPTGRNALCTGAFHPLFFKLRRYWAWGGLSLESWTEYDERLIMDVSMTPQDLKFIQQIAHNQDDLKKLLQIFGQRLDHLESHLDHDEPQNFFFNATFINPVSSEKQKAYLEQGEAELLSVFKEYGVIRFEARYAKG
jgi:hypothetical protein